LSAFQASLRERDKNQSSISGELTPTQVGGGFGSLVGFSIEMMEHMKEVNFLE
jgi:hypothetical protein